ncbi:MAG: phosphate ABC transporter substrate-binding protein PstS [Desulfurococcales archaeon]|nr:phosphate ABC transporter substrate-binding protein PstS [Desulfurococcales archaeon]
MVSLRFLLAVPLVFLPLIAIIVYFASTGAEEAEKTVLIGSGSSFIAPQMYAWASQLKSKYPWLAVEYESVGSGAGLANFLDGVRDFAASDPPLPKNLWEKYRGKVIQLPVILGAIAVIYNLPEAGEGLRLTGEVLALIYTGEIKYWDDPRIKELNPGLNLPSKEIIAVHRSDSSGTTEIFTLFLHKSAPSVWPRELVGKAIDWPVDRKGNGVGAKGNEGVTSTVKSTPYSIGYVEWSYALDSGLPMAAIMNPRGEFLLPSIESIQKAVQNVELPESPLGDFSSLPLDVVYADVEGAYPIVSFTFLIFWVEYPQEKVEAVRTFIEYVSTEGQMEGNVVKGYVPVPDNIRRFNLEAVSLVREG